jgi:hypothetical protein
MVGATGLEPANLLLPKQADYHYPTPRFIGYFNTYNYAVNTEIR